jgi:type VII secretion-associated serine protease mycosin
MRRWGRALGAASLALLMVAAVSTPGTAVAAPRPLSSQWWFTTWGIQDRLWPITQGKGVTVAVLDTGVQADIPDLSGAVLPGKNMTDGNDDARVDKDPNFGHGTVMASLIAARGTGTGFVGVAPAAKILPVRTKSFDSMVSGIRYAADHGAKVINISQGATASCIPSLQQAVSYAIERDVVVVAAAGDEGDSTNGSSYPANCAGVVAVGAIDPTLKPWIKTQQQSYVAVAAPGLHVGGVAKSGQFGADGFGTSQASALTSAVVALVRSKFPNMSARQVVQQIITSAGDVGPKGRDDQTGYGLIRPTRILNGEVPKNGPNPVFDAYDKWKAANAKQTGPAPRSNAEDSSTNPILIGGVGAVAVALLVLLLVVLVRNRRRLQVAQARRAGGPPVFGGPYPPQGGQSPPGGQQPYYPPAGPPGGPPQQGPHPNPGQPGQWGPPPDRRP